jgi:hypothetical protein
MYRVLMLSILAAVVSSAGSAVADSPNLKGDYGATFVALFASLPLDTEPY